MSEKYSVTGCNLFGQWFKTDPIFIGFQDLNVSDNMKLVSKTTSPNASLLYINWSYNVYQYNNKFYVVGSWGGEEGQCYQFKLPEECKSSPETLTLIGNDYHLILIDQHMRKVWMFNMQSEKIEKQLSLDTESPVDDEIATKRMRPNDKIIKSVATNNSCLHLTANGNIYMGLLPSHVDTSHCVGRVCDIACGYEHFVLLTNIGRVYTWGNGRRLQLGHGDISNLDTPTEVEALAGIKIVKISAGGWHSLALSEFGDLYSWGWNDTGQLGIKSPPDCPKGVLKTEDLKSYPLPTVVDIFDENEKTVEVNVKDIACGSRHSIILLEDNSVWASGCNKYGQLGLPLEKATVDYFKKTFQCKHKCKLKCGPWTSILIKNK